MRTNPPPNRKRSRLIALTATIAMTVLTACATAPADDDSVDPGVKLGQAAELFERQSRPLRAEQLIRQAIATYQQRDDAQGLGHAYRAYGELLRSRTVAVQHEKFYREYGFLDRSIRYDTRQDDATRYYRKALDSFTMAAEQRQREQRFDALPNVYVNMAMTHLALAQTPQACTAFDQAIAAYEDAVRRNAGSMPRTAQGTVADTIRAQKAQAGCR